MSSKAPFKFDEFYEAFGKSVASDVIFVDGQIHIVPRTKQSSIRETCSSPKSPAFEPVHALIDAEHPIRKHAKGRLLDSADRRRLPWPIRALLEAQEPDGSWVYSNNFEFIINGIAPPPMEGISGKLWATAIALTVWRQFPEYFELLEVNYEKAMLHADDNVLRIVRSVLQFDALDQIRPYKSDEARAIREQLAREAAAKRELELDEELKIARMREEESRLGKLSLVHARRLPIPTQQLFVSELGDELTKVFTALPPVLTTSESDSALIQSPSAFKVGQIVESCRRRRTNGSVSTATPRWHLCRIAAINEDSRLLTLEFLDGDCERERRIPVKFVRATLAGIQEIRTAEFDALKNLWSHPITCKAEIARLEEARALKLKPLSWNYRHNHTLEGPTRVDDEEPRQDITVTSSSIQRPRSSARLPHPREGSSKDPSCPIDTLFQAAVVVLLQYDRAYSRVHETTQGGVRRYATAVLYRERFHAFDELADSLVALVERTVDALEAVWRWKQCNPSAADGNNVNTFVWRGEDFVAALVRSLDFLGSHCELAEWYGEEFPLDGNPFMRSSSLLDKAEERGLQPAPQELRPSSALREALKLQHCPRAASNPPTWWPESRYSHELLHRIELAEQVERMTCAISDLLSTTVTCKLM